MVDQFVYTPGAGDRPVRAGRRSVKNFLHGCDRHLVIVTLSIGYSRAAPNIAPVRINQVAPNTDPDAPVMVRSNVPAPVVGLIAICF